MHLFDTNIIIDYLKGYPQAASLIEGEKSAAISMITWIEVLVGTTVANRVATEQFLLHFKLIELDKNIARQAVTIRQQHNIKLPDAIIWASALQHNATLVTRNTKDFAKAESIDVLMPYHL